MCNEWPVLRQEWTMWSKLILILTVVVSISRVNGSYIELMEPVAVLEGKPFNLTCIANITGNDGPCELQKRLPNGIWCNFYRDSEPELYALRSSARKLKDCGFNDRLEVIDLDDDSFTVTVSEARLTDGTMYRCRLFSKKEINRNTSVLVLQNPTIDTNSRYVLNSVGEIICSVTYMMPEDVEGTHGPSLRLTLHGKVENGDISEPEFGQKLIVLRRKFGSDTDGAKLVCSAFTTDPSFMVNVTQKLDIFDMHLVIGLTVGLGVPCVLVIIVIMEWRCKCIRKSCKVKRTHTSVKKEDDYKGQNQSRIRTKKNRKPPTFTQKEVEKIIKKHLPDLYKRLSVNDELIAKLHREDVIDDPTYSSLEQKGSEKEKISVIMKSIRCKGVPAFINFCIILVEEDTAQSHIVTEVMKQDIAKIKQRKERLLMEEGEVDTECKGTSV